MTDIEQEFFKVFGIDKKCLHPKDCAHKGVCKGVVACEHYNYSEITDRVLLELICIYNKFNIMEFYCKSTNIEQLKIVILNYCILAAEHNCNAEQFKTQVQALFREVKNDRRI